MYQFEVGTVGFGLWVHTDSVLGMEPAGLGAEVEVKSMTGSVVKACLKTLVDVIDTLDDVTIWNMVTIQFVHNLCEM